MKEGRQLLAETYKEGTGLSKEGGSWAKGKEFRQERRDRQIIGERRGSGDRGEGEGEGRLVFYSTKKNKEKPGEVRVLCRERGTKTKEKVGW